MTLFGLLFLALTIAAILYFTATPAMNARTIRFAVVAGLALAALNMTAARAENIEVVAGADGCTTPSGQIFAPPSAGRQTDLPDPAGLRACHGGIGLTVERLDEVGIVRDHAIGAELGGRVRIVQRHEPGGFRRLGAAPDLGIGQEEALIRRETVDLGLGLSRGPRLVSGIGDMDAAIIRRILAQSQFSIELHIVNRGEAAGLIRQTFCAFLEVLGIFLGPPIIEIAVLV